MHASVRGGGESKVWGRVMLMIALAMVLGCRGSRGAAAADQAGAQAGAGPDGPGSSATGQTESGESGAQAPKREPLSQYMARFDKQAAAAAPALEPAAAGECPKFGDRDRDIGIVISPLHPAKGEELRIMAATLDGEQPLALRVELDRGDEPVTTEQQQRAGVPAATVARFTPSVGGRYQVIVGRDGVGMRCTAFTVREYHFSDDSEVDLSQVWSNQRNWSAAEEALYSAWIRELFSGPADQDLAWKALSEVTSDPDRNLLHDHLGREEDHPSRGFELVPDCADTPYFLRAYWSFKRGLPFGFRKCSRGKKSAPNCFDLRTNLDPPDRRPHWIDPPGAVPPTPPPPAVPGAGPPPEPPPPPPDNAAVPTHNEKIEYFFQRSIGWSVHTGNGRCAFGDSNSDLYPIELARRGLRPGIVYADPYGHILVLAELVAPQGSQPGILFAVDGQPDGSITRKRFWEGNFLWNQSDPSLGGSGFKAFRPIMNAAADGDEELFLQMNDETLAELQDYGDVSNMQQELSPTEFYDLMEQLITPGERSPFAAQAELVAALAEAVRVRVTSVKNGDEYHAQHADELIDMPWGHSVFETSGAWENYSTPARDLRLLIAMDVVAGFADKVRRNPGAFGLDPKGDVERFELTMSYLDEQREQLLADPAHAITYTRSDGSSWKLGLDQVVGRASAFEVAYNPNDCPELRWGAPEGADELATCDRRAPEDQRIKMRYYRTWFVERRRPARGDDGPEIPELAEQQAAL